VSPLQGRFLSLLVKAIGARRILEIGTLGGVSASWMAEALPPDGRVVSLEASPDYAALARRNLERAFGTFLALVSLRFLLLLIW
jgi:predicted O-methyltransferase YrrM